MISHPTTSEEVPTDFFFPPDRARARASLEHQLQKAVLEIITTASLRKDHIPPITTNDLNPFPYQIIVSPKGETWGARMGIF